MEANQPMSASQLHFEHSVEGHVGKLMANYRQLLKKHASLSSQKGIGSHEALQIDVACENIIQHGEHLLSLINELRIRALIRGEEAGERGQDREEEE